MLRTALTVLCIVVVPYESSVAIAQSFPQRQQQPQLLTPEQLDKGRSFAERQLRFELTTAAFGSIAALRKQYSV